MAIATPPPYITATPASLASQLRAMADLIEVYSPLIRIADRRYATGESGEHLTIMNIVMITRPE